MVYGVGQANSIMGAGSVSMPVYENGSLTDEQYPCNYKPVDLFVRPKQIKLGAYEWFMNAGICFNLVVI